MTTLLGQGAPSSRSRTARLCDLSRQRPTDAMPRLDDGCVRAVIRPGS
ncbi:hypothetical protein ACIRG4_14685 [Streptomyces sp. NPDC102395]